jgi:iron(III) transport system permease protein
MASLEGRRPGRLGRTSFEARLRRAPQGDGLSGRASAMTAAQGVVASAGEGKRFVIPFVYFRYLVIALTALAVLAPLSLVFYQSFLTGPFFQPSAKLSLDAYRFVYADDDFWNAFWTTLIISGGMTAIAVPLGAMLAFLMVRTDVPGRSWLEPFLLVPIFVSAVVIAFGYVVAMGPVGFLSIAVKSLIGITPWNLYSLVTLIIIAGLTHVPHVYLYTSAALRGLGSDLEEAARVAGANPWKVAIDVSLPMVLPAILFAGVLVFFLGFELFGLPLVLGDPQGVLVLSTYLFKLTNKLGVPSYQLMAVVVVVIVAVTAPLVFLQRMLLGQAQRYVSMRGKGLRVAPLKLGRWRWYAFAAILCWFAFTVIVPLAGITLRSFVTGWGEGVNLLQVLTLDHYRELLDYPNVIRGMINTFGIGVIGGAVAVACYTAIALAIHRWSSPWTRVVDYLVMVPRAMPGLIAGLAMLWIFLFFRPLTPLKSTLFSVWLAYTIVWLAYGMRLVSSTLLQVGPELEEAARTMGANEMRVRRDVTVPLIKYGMMASWLLVFLIFVREYSTGIYLLGPGTEVIGSLLVSLWGTGAVDLVSALSVVNVAMIAVGLLIAVRLGVRLHG